MPDAVFDGDPQARVKDRDRDRATYVIDAALRNHQISEQDRDLRLERVRSASTVGELDLLVRDIAAAPPPPPATAIVPPPPAPVAVTSSVPPPAADPYATGTPRPTATVPSDLYGPPHSTSTSTTKTRTLTTSGKTGRKVAFGCLGVALLFFIGPVIAGVALFSSQVGGSEGPTTTTDPIPVGPAFELTREGIRDYITTFEDSFDDSLVVRSVFYDGYVVSWVPAGDGNVAIWNYLNGAFEQLGDPMDGSQDTGPVDLADLRPGKVMSLVDTARTTLNVADPTTTYVIYERNIIDNDPQVAVYVTNDAGDSGYLLGDLNGKVSYTQADGG